jgi:hypothetical protein
VAQAGHQVCETALEPRLDLPYPLWLALSFLPGFRFPLRQPVCDPGAFDACLLALPKWTFSCPPVNSFLAAQGRRLPPTAVAVTFGGWDEERYLAALQRRLAALGVPVLGGLAVKKSRLHETETQSRIAGFLRLCFRQEPAHRRAPTPPSTAAPEERIPGDGNHG